MNIPATPTQTPNDSVSTPNQAAVRLRVHPATVYRMINEGKLNFVMIRGYKRIPESEIMRALAVKTVA